ncbi:MAG: hypothetical protein EXR72_18100 [Myxococcales bacterium]|nr:hypothetical protein [Myxococcales bacterium]
MRITIIAAALLLVACAKQTVQSACDPCTMAGTHCDEALGYCVSDATADMATTQMSCSPPCAGQAPFCTPAKKCVVCGTDANCPLGTVCKNPGDVASLCAPGCTDDSRCKPDGGVSGMSCCGNLCLDTSNDPKNCGGCGKICAPVHSKGSCTGGACKAGACDPGWADCNTDPKDGCEVNLHVDPDNCTACGMKCALPNAINACANGCYTHACSPGFSDCNNDSKDGCEVKLPNANATCADILQWNILMKKDITYQGVNYLLLKVSFISANSASDTWCTEYTKLCQGFGFLPTGCGAQFNSGGYLTCKTMYLSDGVSNTLGCNPSSGVVAAAQAAGFNDATSQNSFAFHSCDINTCKKLMCSGGNCNTALSYIDFTKPFGYTLCKKP